MAARIPRPILLALALAACLAALSGCSPLLYALLSLRHGSAGGELAVGTPVDGSTSGEEDAVTPPCGSPDGAGDETWTFVPPTTARYRLTVDGEYDCVLAVYGPDDEHLSAGCNDDSGSNNHSQLDLDLAGGRRYFVVVDGYHDNEGSYRLAVEQIGMVTAVPGTPPGGGPGLPTVVPEDPAGMQPRCEAAPILTAGTVTGNLDPTVATARTSCGSGPGGDVIYRLVVPQPAQVTVKLEAIFDGILELRTGCSSGVLACNDDTGDALHSMIAMQLQPGTYFVIVDTYDPRNAGAFTLQVIVDPIR